MGVTRTGDGFDRMLKNLKAQFEVKGLILSDKQITDLIGKEMGKIDLKIEGIFEVPKSRGRKVTILLNRKKRRRT